MKLNMKKIGLIALSFVLMLCGIFIAAGCSKKNNESGISKTETDGSKTKVSEKINVVTTVYPVYDWIKNICGDAANVEYIIGCGTDLHSFTPSAKDIIKVTGKETDLFVYIGGESDFWIEKISDRFETNGVPALNLMKENKSVLVCEEEHEHHHHHDGEHCEECEHEHEHEHAEHEHEHHHEGEAFDEHIWLSVKRAPVFINSICEKLCSIDSENAEVYKKNAEEYCKELAKLDKGFNDAVKNAKDKTIILADRNPFRYLSEDYGLNIVAAFHGCSAETEASFETITRLADEANEHKVSFVLRTDTGTDEIANTVIKNCEECKVAIMILNGMQGPSMEGKSYLDIMRGNVKVITALLN